MMLVHKPLSFSTTPFSHNQHHSHPNQHHRRNPSAPVLIQPTSKPGLFSLSMVKPSSQAARSSPQLHQQQAQRSSSHHHNHHRSPKSKPAAVATQQSKTSPWPAHAEAQQGALKTGKDKITQRSASPTSHSRRPRQPSPPINVNIGTTTSSPSSKPTLSDPFLAHSDSESDALPRPTAPVVNVNLKLKGEAGEVRPTPRLADPSGKLAKRRRHPNPTPHGTPTPAPTKAVAVPRHNRNGYRSGPNPSNGKSSMSNNATAKSHAHTRAHSALMNLSRSAPSASSPSLTTMGGAFPICDDTDTTTEGGHTDDEDNDGVTPPATPTRPGPTTERYDDGPRTAPLSFTYGRASGFPFGGPSSSAGVTPSPAQRQGGTANRTKHSSYHIRAPSEGEGVFNLSFDEDSSASSGSEEWPGASAMGGMEREKLKMKMLFGVTPRRMQEFRFGNGQQKKAKGEKEKASLYASSLFQNSPSPDDLPPPAF